MQTLIQSIRYNNGKFPFDRIQKIIERREEAIPFLLQIMQELLEKGNKHFFDRESRHDYLYALYLLAQFRSKELYPLLMELLTKPDEELDELFGGTLTEDMSRILLSVYNGHPEPLMRLIEDPGTGESVRVVAAATLTGLVFHQSLTREFVLDYFKQLLNDKLPLLDDHSNIYSEVVRYCNKLYPAGIYEDIRGLFEKNRVDASLIDLDEVLETLSEPEEEVLQESGRNPEFQLIDDTIAEMHWWPAFQPEKSAPARTSATVSSSVSREPKHNPAVKVEKIGRNDPCPCGSGKKYKKCCGA
jgi:uncharacterized protein YecA (UPF0149 family)